MNADYFAQFYETAGYKVIRTKSSYWYSASQYIYRSLPPNHLIDPSEEELQELFRQSRLIGVQFPSLRKAGTEAGLFVVRDKGYGLHSTQRQFRQHVQKGIKHCEVSEINFDYLYHNGMPVNLDTIARWNHKVLRFTDLKLWRRLCDAGKNTPGAGAMGSFVQGKLVSYLVYFIVDKTCHGMYLMSRTDMGTYCPNHVLYYAYTKELISREGVEAVTTGLQALPPLEQVDQFKRHAGYQKEICYTSVVLRPATEFLLLNRVTDLALNIAERVAGTNAFLQRFCAVLDTAEATRRSSTLRA